LQRPVDEIVATGKPEFPFCLCWANENWTRVWDGLERQVLMKQAYSVEADRRHIADLAKYFRDSRYIRIHGKPVFLVYRASSLPDPKRTLEVWREEAQRLGLGELYLCRVESMGGDNGKPLQAGFDAAVEFAPDWTVRPPEIGRTVMDRLLRKLGRAPSVYLDHSIRSYEALIRSMLAKPEPDYLRFRCVTPSWDNSSRRTSGSNIFIGSDPTLYQEWLERVIAEFRPPSEEENLVFINAWNEWGEGNHLEPCARWGRGYLDATRAALSRRKTTELVSTDLVVR